MIDFVLITTIAIAFWLHSREMARRIEEGEAASREIDSLHQRIAALDSELALSQIRIAEAADRREVARRESFFDVNITILLPQALQKFGMGTMATRLQAIADAAFEMLAIPAAEVVVVRGIELLPAAQAGDARTLGLARGAAAGPVRELERPATWRELVEAQPVPLQDALRASAPGLADDDLLVPIATGGAAFAILLARGTTSSPMPEGPLRKLAVVLAAAGALAIEHADASSRLEERNRALGRSAQDATWAVRRAEERLVRTGQLARFGEFAASVAHNLKTPLQFLRGELELLEEKHRDAKLQPEELGESLETLLRHCQRMRTEIDQAMTFVRPGAAEAADVDLVALLREVQQLLQGKAAEFGVVLIVADGAPEARVRGSLDNLRHAVANLVGNAIDAMPGGGTVTLSLGRANGAFEILVADDGPGLPEKVRDKLFTPFVSTKGEQGTGLGLASCRRIVEEEHSGEIGVVPSSKGTTFRIRLRA